MKVSFTTKAESNKLQQEEFLKLSPVERFYAFLELSERLQKFPVSKKRPQKDNFVIHINKR